MAALVKIQTSFEIFRLQKCCLRDFMDNWAILKDHYMPDKKM